MSGSRLPPPVRSGDFVPVDVAPGPASEDGVQIRFRAIADARIATELHYEHDDGTAGTWAVEATDDESARVRRIALAIAVDDSSAGTSTLVLGGEHGLVLRHAVSHAEVRVAYLLLSPSSVRSEPFGA